MENRPLFNKVANEILLEVKPLKLRERIILQVLDLIDKEKDVSYNEGFIEGSKSRRKNRSNSLEPVQLSIFDTGD